MGLSQVEEMLIARTLPIIHIYVKPGGLRSYSGHCVNVPQNITELANILPRFPKDLSIIIIKYILAIYICTKLERHIVCNIYYRIYYRLFFIRILSVVTTLYFALRL